MKKYLLVILISGVIISCKSSSNMQSSKVLDYGSPSLKQTVINDYTFKITEYSNDKTYGYTQENPIMVGGSKTLQAFFFLTVL